MLLSSRYPHKSHAYLTSTLTSLRSNLFLYTPAQHTAAQSQVPNSLIYTIFTTCTSIQYSAISATKNPRNEFAGLTNPRARAIGGMYGSDNPTAMTRSVETTNTGAARRWMTGIFAVRRRCTITVCVSKPSRNQCV